MIPAALSQAKSDPRLPAVARVLLWCREQDTAVAPKCDAAAHALQIPRRTAARAIATLVTCGVLHRETRRAA